MEKERQLQVQVKSLQNRVRNEKEEVRPVSNHPGVWIITQYFKHFVTFHFYSCQVQKLQNIIASRASQYNHEMKRKEREFYKLKERLNQLLVDKKDKKQSDF